MTVFDVLFLLFQSLDLFVTFPGFFIQELQPVNRSIFRPGKRLQPVKSIQNLAAVLAPADPQMFVQDQFVVVAVRKILWRDRHHRLQRIDVNYFTHNIFKLHF